METEMAMDSQSTTPSVEKAPWHDMKQQSCPEPEPYEAPILFADARGPKMGRIKGEYFVFLRKGHPLCGS